MARRVGKALEKGVVGLEVAGESRPLRALRVFLDPHAEARPLPLERTDQLGWHEVGVDVDRAGHGDGRNRGITCSTNAWQTSAGRS